MARDDSHIKTLILRVQQGEEAAFAGIVHHFQDYVFTIICQLVRNRTVAQDLTQEVFIRVYRFLPNFRWESQFKTWLYRLVRNVCNNYFRSQKMYVNQFTSLEDDEQKNLDVPDSFSLENELIGENKQEIIRKALDVLSEQYRFILLLHYYEGLKYTEIAEILQQPLGTVKTQLHRGMKLLKKQILLQVSEVELR